MLNELLVNKRTIFAAIGLVALLGAYFKGRSDESAAWNERRVEAAQKLHRLEVASDSLVFVIREATAAKIEADKKLANAVASKISQRRSTLDSQGALPKDAVDLFNESARGSK